MSKRNTSPQDPDEAVKKTQEFKTFEDAAKRILKIPKSEIERREAEDRKRKLSS